MNRKNFLYITTSPMDSNNSPDLRNRPLLEGLIQAGYEAYTLTQSMNIEQGCVNYKAYYLDGQSYAHKVSDSLKTEKNILISRAREFIVNVIGAVSIYDIKRFLLNYLDDVTIANNDYSFVISSSDSKVSHLIADRLLKSGRVTTKLWIQYWGDPFYLDINRRSILPGLFVKREEKRLLELADYVFYTTPFTVDAQKRLYRESGNKMYYIPTPYIEPKMFAPTSNNRVIVGYYGKYEKQARNIMPLYNAAKMMSEIHFQFVGKSDLKLKEIRNIHVRHEVSYEQILEYQAKCDILVCLANNPGTTQIPGKLYHYAATNKPILFIYEKDEEGIADFVKSIGRFFVCENNEESIKTELNNILPKLNKIYKPVEEFACKRVAETLLKIVRLDDTGSS